MFVDEVDIQITAGSGGNGCLSFRREKFVPRGGPDGGDGGHGGSVYVTAIATKNTLVDFRFHPEFKARSGQHGQGSNRTGQSAHDLDVTVPIGTLVYEKSDGEARLLADLAEEGQRVLVGTRRPRRTRQRAVRQLHQSRAATHGARRARRGEVPSSRAETDRRRRPDRFPQRGQVHADFASVCGKTEDRELPVHDARAQPWRREPERQPQLRRR